MKKFAIILLLSILAANMGAQEMSDAIRYSTNDYKGSARTLGMGNAVTAVGGDLGSVTINPAGSAVGSYSQMTFSPGLSFYGSKETYYPVAGNNNNVTKSTDNYTRMTCPNFGFTMKYDTGNSGLKSVTFGMIGNQTDNFVKTIYGRGVNDQTSFLGAMAYEATGYQSSALNASSAYDSNLPWRSVVAYQGGMIATYGGNTDQYVGSTEKIFTENGNTTIATGGALNQRYGQQTRGNKYDVVFNVGFNINDMLFLGANLGITSLDYTYDEYFKEAAVDPSNFEIEFDGGVKTNFTDARYRYSYDANGTGVYAKFGALFTPIAGLRLGAAIQTPTTIELTEHWGHAAETKFDNSQYNASAQSPRGEYTYKLRTPYRVNAGIAYAFDKYALISADYEMCDYSTMKFMEKDSNDNSSFGRQNDAIQNYAGIQHMLRIGAEVKPIPQFAIRAGYNYTTSPELDSDGKALDSNVSAFTFGFGYSSEGSFFTDLAFKSTKYPKEYIAPYSDYILDSSNKVLTYSPEVLNKGNLCDIVWTIGWRF